MIELPKQLRESRRAVTGEQPSHEGDQIAEQSEHSLSRRSFLVLSPSARAENPLLPSGISEPGVKKKWKIAAKS